MGLNEYDRIRSKNKLHQQSYDYYCKLSAEGLSDEAIAALMRDLSKTDSDNPRNDIYSTVLKMIEGSNEEMSTTNVTNSCGSDADSESI